MLVRDLSSIDLSLSPGNTGTDGTYLKCRIVENGIPCYYKFSLFDEYRGFYGYESFNEVIAYRLGRILGLNVLKQSLVTAKVRVKGVEYTTVGCMSRSYKRKSENRMTIGEFYIRYRLSGESPLATLTRLNYSWFTDILFLFDYLIISRDRHDSNIEVLTDGTNWRFAPLYDNGVSLLAPINLGLEKDVFRDHVNRFNPLADVVVNNFIGSKSLQKNLENIKNPVRVNRLTKEDKSRLFYEMNSHLPRFYKDKIWEIICLRYSYLRKVGILVEN